MDRTGIIVVSMCAALLVFWFFAQQKETARWQQQQRQFAATNIVTAAQMPATNGIALSSAPATTSTAAVAFDIPQSGTPENLITISNAHARYTFTSRGGGLSLVELLDYPETVSARWKKSPSTNGVASLNTRAPAPVLAVLGDSNLIGDGNFALAKTDDGIRAEKFLPNGLRIVKEFHVSSNYLVNASVSLKNSSDKPLALPAQEWVVGTATPMGPDDNGMYLGAMWCDGTNTPQDCALSYFSTNTTTFFVFPRTPNTIYHGGVGNVVWAAAHNQFFALIAMPKQPAQQIISRPVNLPLMATNQTAVAEGIQTALIYPAQTLAADQTVERQIVFFAGPKEYRTLARIGEEFGNRADLVMQFGFFGFFAKALLSAMNWLHDATKLGYGWTIVLITVIIKIVFWPLTAASTRSMKKMQALAPEVKVLKEKYKDDPQKFTQKQMELWKKNKVSPMGGCLPMLIQTPIFIGFFTMIRSAIELRGAHFLWVADLSKPDTLFMIPGLNFPFNLLPLLMGGSMLWQSHLTPASPGMDPAQQKMMRFMPLLILLFLYNYSAGLALYWTVNNLLTIAQTKMTKASSAPVAGTIPALTPPAKKKK
jgi:YidC/Oxa1 family membrane protein insertase